MIKFIGFYDYTVILTFLSLLAAVIGMAESACGEFTIAILCLVVAGICDAFDGTVARSKKNRTEDEKAYGIQLDSICDVISFGVFPGFLCYHMGVNGKLGMIIVFFYCLCAVIRLSFFNVQEMKRQQVEEGCNKYYRGLPVTSISIIFPAVYCTKYILPAFYFNKFLYVMLLTVAFLFILDFRVRKMDFSKLFTR